MAVHGAWMSKSGGESSLSEEDRESAFIMYEKWVIEKQEEMRAKGNTDWVPHSFASYVDYVQRKHANGENNLNESISQINSLPGSEKYKKEGLTRAEVEERMSRTPIQVSQYWQKYDITGEKYIDPKNKDFYDLNYIEFLKFQEDPIGLIALAQDRIKRMLTSAAHISPERGEEITKLLYEKINAYSRGDDYVDMDDAEVTSIINSVIVEDSDKSKIIIGIVKGIIENMELSMHEYDRSEAQKKAHKVIDNYDSLTKFEKQAIDMLQKETSEINAVVNIINNMETDDRFYELREGPYIEKIKELSLKNEEPDALFDKMQATVPSLTKEKMTLIFDSYKEHYEFYKKSIEQEEIGAREGETALGGSPILNKVQNSIIGDTMYKYVPKAKVLEDRLDNLKVDGVKLQDILKEGFKIKNKDGESEIVTLSAHDVYNVNMLKDQILTENKDTIEKRFNSFAKLHNALIGLDRFSRKAGDFEEAIDHALEIIPKEYRRDKLSNYLTDELSANFNKDKIENNLDIQTETRKALNAADRLDIVDRRKHMKSHEVKDEVRRNISTYRAKTLGEVYNNMVYEKIANIKKDTLQNFQEKGIRGLDNALFELRGCLASSLTEKNHVQTMESMANECVKKYIDAQKKESEQTLQIMNGGQAIFLGASGLGALIALYAIYKDVQSEIAEKNLAAIEAETYKHISMLDTVDTETEAIGQKIYGSIKTSREDYFNERFKDAKEKDIKSAIFYTFAKDISTFYTLGKDSTASFKTKEAMEYRAEANEIIFQNVFNLNSMDYINMNASIENTKEGMISKIKRLQEEIRKTKQTLLKSKNVYESKSKAGTLTAEDGESLKRTLELLKKKQNEEKILASAIKKIDAELIANKLLYSGESSQLLDSQVDDISKINIIKDSLNQSQEKYTSGTDMDELSKNILTHIKTNEATIKEKMQTIERPYLQGKTNEKFLDVYYQGLKESGGTGIINTVENLSKAANGSVDIQFEIIKRQEKAIREELLKQHRLFKEMDKDTPESKANLQQSRINLLVKLYQENVDLGKSLLLELSSMYDDVSQGRQHKYTNIDVFSLFEEISQNDIQEILQDARKNMDSKLADKDTIEGSIAFDQRDDNIYISFMSNKQQKILDSLNSQLDIDEKIKKDMEQTRRPKNG